MRIAKTNILPGAAPGFDYDVTSGTIIDGSLSNLTNPDFSNTTTIKGSPIDVSISLSGNTNYVCLHDVAFSEDDSDKMLVVVFDDTNQIYSEEIKNRSSLFFIRAESNNDWGIRFRRLSSASEIVTVTISYMRTGIYTDWPRNGLRGGEYLAPFGNNKLPISMGGDLAQPIIRSMKNIVKQVTIKCPNAPMSFATDDLQDIFDSYNVDGVMSVQMLDDDIGSAFAGYDLDDSINANPDLQSSLVSISLTCKAAL